MNNLKMKIEMTKRNLKQWQVANLLGISESVFSRKMRNELSKEEQEKIIDVIKRKGDVYEG